MIRAPGPRAPVATGNAGGMWWVLGLGWGMAGLAWLVWAAARLAAVLAGGWVPPFGTRWVGTLIRGRAGQA